ncbi:MAG: type II toxin-antitoxin system VapC family toxin [Saprospiraceae bacterium]
MNYLLDTNAAIDYIGGALPDKAIAWLDGIVDSEAAISVINQIEMLGLSPADPADIVPFEELAAAVTILSLDPEVVIRCIALRKGQKIKLPDAIVAATALVHGLVLVSRNEADFKRIPDLRLINPYSMA